MNCSTCKSCKLLFTLNNLKNGTCVWCLGERA